MKKRFAIFFALILSVTALGQPAVQAGSIPTALGAVTGNSLTDGATYTISSEDELAKLAELVNGGEDCLGNFFVLTCDIALSADHDATSDGNWTPIGYGSYITYFKGSFYGQNHTISGLNIQANVNGMTGLFGSVGSDGLLADLTVSGSMGLGLYCGGIAGYNWGLILNCTSNITYTNNTTVSTSYIGGIAGANDGVIRNCVNTGNLNGYLHPSGLAGDRCVGGIAGCCGVDAEIINCRNTGNITGQRYIGGIAGSTNNAYTSAIMNCCNTGNITAYDVCGGIIGMLNNTSQLSNCWSTGSISANSSAVSSGAVAGGIGENCTAENCYWLNTAYTTNYGASLSAVTNFVTFTGTDTLASAVDGTTSLYTALNHFVDAHTSDALLNWTGGTSLPALTGTEILLNPSDKWALLGSTADFTAHAAGSSVSYQWQVSADGINWNNVSNGSGGTTPTYTTPAVTADMIGSQYRCVFSGSVNSGSATLSLGSAPQITTQPADFYAVYGEEAVFSIVGTGSPTPDCCWYISFDGLEWYSYSQDFMMSLPPTEAYFIGIQVRCELSSDFGNVMSDTVTLRLATAPVITTQPASRTVTAGGSAGFAVATTGEPAPTYQWQISLDGTTWHNVTNGLGATNADYTTPAATSALSGCKYRCVATNKAGSVYSDAAVLTVNPASFSAAGSTESTVPLMLTSSNSEGVVHIGGLISLLPTIEGGAWDWDKEYFAASFGSSAVFTALKSGTSTITYTAGGVRTSYTVTIAENLVPSTGQHTALIYLFSVFGVVILAAVIILILRRHKHSA